MKFIDLFAGVGGFRLGLERSGFECAGWCEQDKFAQKSYRAIHDTEGEWFSDDIRDVQPKQLPEHELLTGGFPCQSFSIAGERGGFDDTRGTLFFEIARLAKERQPEYLLLENVRGLLSHDGGKTFGTILNTLSDLGYSVEWQVLNSKNFGVPQNRERVFIVGHLGGFSGRQLFPIGREARKNTGSNGKLKQVGNYKEGKREIDNPETGRVYSEEGISPCLNTMSGGDREPKVARGLNITKDGDSYCIDSNYAKGKSPNDMGSVRRTQIVEERVDEGTREFKDLECGTIRSMDPGGDKRVVEWIDGPDDINETVRKGGRGSCKKKDNCDIVDDGVRVRKLTPKECWRLQGFPDQAFEKAEKVNSDTQLYKQAGNSVTVNVIEAIGKRLKKGANQ